MVLQLTDFTSEITDEELREFTSEYYIPFALHPVVPAASASIADFPEGKVGGSLPRDERPPPGSYSMEDAELINENRIPINAYSEAFLCHMGISRNYFQSPEEVPTFIGDDGQEMDLFSVVHLSKPKLVTEGVRPLRDGEEPLLESTAGRTMELVLEQPEVESTDVLAPTPLRSVPGATVEPPRLDATSVGSSEDADVVGAESEAGEVDSWVEKYRGPPVIGRLAGHANEGAVMSGLVVCVEATSDSSAPVTHAVQSPPQTSIDCVTYQGRDSETTSHGLVAQLRVKVFLVNAARGVQMDEEILAAEAQLAGCRRLSKVFEVYAQSFADGKNGHCFVKRVEELLEKQEEKLRKLSIEYDEELYPHMLSAIAERRWLISHGMRLAAMSALESQEVKQSFGDVVKCALARGKAGRELPHIAKHESVTRITPYLDVAQTKVPNLLPCPRDILNPFALEKEIPLKESLEAHAIRLAKKEGALRPRPTPIPLNYIKAILCGVGAAHHPHSDGSTSIAWRLCP
ncbi:hypothetical protein Tco_0000717 [Tanacetum coccineum]